MKAKKVIYMLTAALTLGLAVCTYAATVHQLSFVERFETGKVDIDVQELSVMKEGEEAETMNIVEANKDVSYIPRIINRNADCYIRASIDVVMDGECEQPLNVEHIYGKKLIELSAEKFKKVRYVGFVENIQRVFLFNTFTVTVKKRI